jgi:hypothetical protein
VDRSFARLGLEVRSGITDSQWHGLPPLVTAASVLSTDLPSRAIYDKVSR